MQVKHGVQKVKNNPVQYELVPQSASVSQAAAVWWHVLRSNAMSPSARPAGPVTIKARHSAWSARCRCARRVDDLSSGLVLDAELLSALRTRTTAISNLRSVLDRWFGSMHTHITVFSQSSVNFPANHSLPERKTSQSGDPHYSISAPSLRGFQHR